MSAPVDIAGRQTHRGRRRRRTMLPAAAVTLAVLVAPAALFGDDEIDYSPGLLSEAHSGFDDPDSCENCHNDEYEVEGERCLVCHDRIAARMEAGKGVHREVSVDDCAVCHAVEVSQYSGNLMAHAHGNLVENPLYQDLGRQIIGVPARADGTLTFGDPDPAIEAQGCLRTGKHHEIYLSDIRRAAPKREAKTPSPSP